MIAQIMVETNALRSCFIDFDDIKTACDAIVALQDAQVVPYWINGISQHENDVSVFFALHCDHLAEDGFAAAAAFIEQAEALGGRYSGS